MPIDPITYHLIQLQTRRAILVAEQNKLQQHINEIDESIRIISELSNAQDIVTESLYVFCQQFGRYPDPNERVVFRLG